MPVSKKPRAKAKATRNQVAQPQVPTRRIREEYVAQTTPDMRSAALTEADGLVAQALASDMPRLINTAVYQALSLSPLCANAYVALAHDALHVDVALDLFKRAVHAAELALGAEAFEQLAGQFGETPETQPYLLALQGLVDVLLEMDQEEAAVEHMQTMLRLGPSDDLGVRHALLSYYLDQFDLQPARALLNAFPEETSMIWHYSRVLLAYRDELQAEDQTQRLIEAALAANQYVPGILLKVEPAACVDEGEDVPLGSREEATVYVTMFAEAWTSTPGAAPWLMAQAAASGAQFP